MFIQLFVSVISWKFTVQSVMFLASVCLSVCLSVESSTVQRTSRPIVHISNHTVSQKKAYPPFTSRSLYKHCPILLIFGRNIPEIYWFKEMFSFPTSPNWVLVPLADFYTRTNSTLSLYDRILHSHIHFIKITSF